MKHTTILGLAALVAACHASPQKDAPSIETVNAPQYTLDLTTLDTYMLGAKYIDGSQKGLGYTQKDMHGILVGIDGNTQVTSSPLSSLIDEVFVRYMILPSEDKKQDSQILTYVSGLEMTGDNHIDALLFHDTTSGDIITGYYKGNGINEIAVREIGPYNDQVTNCVTDELANEGYATKIANDEVGVILGFMPGTKLPQLYPFASDCDCSTTVRGYFDTADAVYAMAKAWPATFDEIDKQVTAPGYQQRILSTAATFANMSMPEIDYQ